MSREQQTRQATITHPKYRCVARGSKVGTTAVSIGRDMIDDYGFFVIAGPCAVESREQILGAATAVLQAGAKALRGGAYKPRTSPYSFQGLGEQGLKLLAEAGQETGLPVVTEILTPEDLPLVCRYADVLQVGARNMQNFALLKALGKVPQPVVLKRGMSATIEEFLLAAEYIVSSGNPNVVLCERGIRTFETATRNTLDLNAVALLKDRCHLPVIVDPSHGTGVRSLVPSLSKAAVATGADGLMIEVHPDPDSALSDGHQSMTPIAFKMLMNELACLAPIVGRSRFEQWAEIDTRIARENIQVHRERIDRLDQAIVNLLIARVRAGHCIGANKQVLGLPLHDAERERQVLQRVSELIEGPLSTEAIVQIFTAITRATLETEEQEACTTGS